MLRKNKNIQPLTKQDLEKTLKNHNKVILEAVDERFNKVDRKFEAVSERFNRVDQRLEKADQQMKDKFDKVLKGQDKICKQLTDLQTESKAGLELYKDHEKRITKLELTKI